eukprot:29023-Chlamydomonas_euryale.AAC.8
MQASLTCAVTGPVTIKDTKAASDPSGVEVRLGMFELFHIRPNDFLREEEFQSLPRQNFAHPPDLRLKAQHCALCGILNTSQLGSCIALRCVLCACQTRWPHLLLPLNEQAIKPGFAAVPLIFGLCLASGSLFKCPRLKQGVLLDKWAVQTRRCKKYSEHCAQMLAKLVNVPKWLPPASCMGNKTHNTEGVRGSAVLLVLVSNWWHANC